jgi:hypothetical protein
MEGWVRLAGEHWRKDCCRRGSGLFTDVAQEMQKGSGQWSVTSGQQSVISGQFLVSMCAGA